MSRITQQLLRKRAEHNEMMLTNLEEITLHQEEILKIENLDVYCRHLKILLLQNNIIDRMENLHKLKELEYLNLALNNISVIEGIEPCESLQKLDLTVNFVDVETFQKSMKCLSKCSQIKELYMTGNPCTDWIGYRDYVIAWVPTLQTLDGKDIHPSERIKAIQRLPLLEEDLLLQIQKKANLPKTQTMGTGEPDEKVPYTSESRKKMYLELAEQKIEKDKRNNPEKYEPKQETTMYLKDGKPRQCDEGGYKPILNQWDDPENIIFKIKLPIYMDTSFVNVQLFPTFVSVRIKGKLTQLRLDEEILVDKSTIQRSTTTGELLITMPKLSPNTILKKMVDRQKQECEQKEKQQTEQQRIAKLKEVEAKDLLIQKIEAKRLIQNDHYANDNNDDDVPDLE